MLAHQLTRITKERGALRHDDRIDVLSMAVGYWVDQMAADVDKEMKVRKHDLLDKELDRFMQNVVNPNQWSNEEPRWFHI